jgi:ribose transport system ATP-binding protein
MEVPILALKNITKLFPGVRALDNVSFDLRAGEVHVIAGENGAGKSTLIKIVSGAYNQDAGNIYIEGELATIHSTHKAQELGIATIYQEFNLVAGQTVAQNIYLGHEPKKFGNLIIDWKQTREDASKLLTSLGIELHPDTYVSDLSVSHRQLVEIAKALSREAKIIIFDEPTGTLTSKDIDFLFDLIRRLKSKGIGIIYISHRMDEIAQIGDRITVLRDGRYIDTFPVKDMDLDAIIFAMLNKEMSEQFPRFFSDETGPEALSVSGLQRNDELKNINFHVNQKEIVGFYGLIGSGRTEVMRTIFGLDPFDEGVIKIHGERFHPTPKGALEKGIAFIPGDRDTEGLCLRLTVQDNIIHAAMTDIFRRGYINPRKERELVAKYIKELRIKTPHMEQQVNYLSGGNKQKVVLAKWLLTQASIFIFDEPTRGIDVGSKAEFHKLIDQLVQEGAAVIMISSEIPEIMGMSDRVYIMRRGEIVDMYTRNNATKEKILESAITETVRMRATS